jgi:hypothetical protein
MTSGGRLVVKIIAESLSQYDKKTCCTNPTIGIRIEKKKKKKNILIEKDLILRYKNCIKNMVKLKICVLELTHLRK